MFHVFVHEKCERRDVVTHLLKQGIGYTWIYCRSAEPMCFLVSGGGDLHVGIPTGRIHADGRRLYLYMEEGKIYVALNLTLE
jgi:hypothetical protein